MGDRDEADPPDLPCLLRIEGAGPGEGVDDERDD
jgi:hypothetical protein